MTSPTSYVLATSHLFCKSTRTTSKALYARQFPVPSCALFSCKFKKLRCDFFFHLSTLSLHPFLTPPPQVDVDQALAGIDKLLKSQELTFAFVGVAPALSFVYVAGGYFRGLFAGASRYGYLGGTRRRTAAWLAMRRIERLLITQPHTHDGGRKGAIPHLTAGLLLLSVSSLRQYAETWLPPRSRLREGFLEDVGDLEDPALDREEKMRVVERMWRSWGHALGWEHLAAGVSSS